MTPRSVELRSDTFTRPTESMRRAMYEAEVGDDVWGEDPTVRQLEERAATVTEKEAALFVSSGTQGNLVGLLSHSQQGDEVILGDESHIFWYEVAGPSVVGGLQMRTLPNDLRGRLEPDNVARAIRKPDIHFPHTGCVALENTHNRCGGTVLGEEEIESVARVAHDRGVPVHIDGARIFNAAAALDVPVNRLVSQADSVTFALSKGLGAPVGSVLCGSREYITKARRWRKLLGGGMRQVGVLAAAGLVALSENVERLKEDHANARLLAQGLDEIEGISSDPNWVESNIVLFDIGQLRVRTLDFVAQVADQGVRVAALEDPEIRAVTSYEVSRADIEYAVAVVAQVARQSLPVTA